MKALIVTIAQRPYIARLLPLIPEALGWKCDSFKGSRKPLDFGFQQKLFKK